MGLKLIAKGIIEPGTIDGLKEIFNRFENILSSEAQELKPLEEERKLLRKKEQDAKKAYFKIWNSIKAKKDKGVNIPALKGGAFKTISTVEGIFHVFGDIEYTS